VLSLPTKSNISVYFFLRCITSCLTERWH